MITKLQALNLKYRDEILQTHAYRPLKVSNFPFTIVAGNGCTNDVDWFGHDPIKWRINGKIQTWKTRPDEFKIPIKHGLYDYSYLSHENAHLFTLESEQ